MAAHLYKVSQDVVLADSAGVNLKPFATYKIVATRPERGTQLQYRVKGEHEQFERVVDEFQITALESSASAGE